MQPSSNPAQTRQLENFNLIDVEILNIEYFEDLDITYLTIKDPRGKDVIYYQSFLIQGDQREKRYRYFRDLRDHQLLGNFILRFSPSNKVGVLQHRYISTGIRKHGIATSMLQDLVHRMQQAQTGIQEIELNTGQISVIDWAMKQGFKPRNALDQERLDKINKYRQGENPNIFEKANPIYNNNEPHLYFYNADNLTENLRIYLRLALLDQEIANRTNQVRSNIQRQLSDALIQSTDRQK